MTTQQMPLQSARIHALLVLPRAYFKEIFDPGILLGAGQTLNRVAAKRDNI